jgi:hypothetical protein
MDIIAGIYRKNVIIIWKSATIWNNFEKSIEIVNKCDIMITSLMDSVKRYAQIKVKKGRKR